MSTDTTTPTRSTLGAIGLGVSNLQRSADFYMRVLGMTQLQTFKLPHMDEIVLGLEGSRGSAIVLMHWTDGSNPTYRDLPIKIVLYVPDPVAVAAADLDGDGNVELLSVNSGSNDVSLLLGEGKGAFAADVRQPVGETPRGIATGDLNDDGRLDVVVVVAESGVALLLHTPLAA